VGIIDLFERLASSPLFFEDKYAMTADPYATPTSELSNTTTCNPAFYVVSKSKFALLFVSTCGFYLPYWFYKNWKQQRAAGNNVLPLLRTIFGVFFIYSLLVRIDRKIRASDRQLCWFPRSLAVGVITIACVGIARAWVPDFRISFAISLTVVLLQTCFLLRVQGAINFSENDPDGTSNSSLTFSNWVWVALGLCIWGLSIFALYLQL
jgi:hypothetical protein